MPTRRNVKNYIYAISLGLIAFLLQANTGNASVVTLKALLTNRVCKGAFQSRIVSRKGRRFIRYTPGLFKENIKAQMHDSGIEALEILAKRPLLARKLKIRAHVSPIGVSVHRQMKKNPEIFKTLKDEKLVTFKERVFYSPKGSNGVENIFMVEEIEYPSPQTLNQILDYLGNRSTHVAPFLGGEFSEARAFSQFMNKKEFLINIKQMASHDFGFHFMGYLALQDRVVDRAHKLFSTLDFLETDKELSSKAREMIRKTKDWYFEQFADEFIGRLNDAVISEKDYDSLTKRFRKALKDHSFLTSASPLDMITSMKNRIRTLTQTEFEKNLREIKKAYPSQVDPAVIKTFKKDEIDSIAEEMANQIKKLETQFSYSKLGQE